MANRESLGSAMGETRKAPGSRRASPSPASGERKGSRGSL